MERLFFQLVDDIDNVISDEINSDILREIAARFALSHIAYLGINIPRVNEQAHIVTTYNDQWVRRYVSQGYVATDPVIQVGLRGILPLDWKDVREANPAARHFFGESREFGLGRQGLSIPIRGVHGETAVFSINADRSDRAWASEKRALMRDFQVLAYHFHTRVLEYYRVQKNDVVLSPKETECLKWVAAGKTTFEIGIILHISERTIRFFLESARAKLDTVNSAQAVARAIRLGLI